MEQARQDTEGVAHVAGRGSVRPRRDRLIKLAFLVVTAVALAAIYYSQRGLSITGWGGDLGAALAQAAVEDRPVVVFFAGSPPGQDDRWIKGNIIAKPENEAALEKGRFIRVLVNIGRVSTSKTAARYNITELPTLVVFGPDGVEKNRREGRIGEVEFRTGFLDCSQVIGPAATSRPG